MKQTKITKDKIENEEIFTTNTVLVTILQRILQRNSLHYRTD